MNHDTKSLYKTANKVRLRTKMYLKPQTFCVNLLIGGLEFSRPINYAKLNNKFAFTSNLALNMLCCHLKETVHRFVMGVVRGTVARYGLL